MVEIGRNDAATVLALYRGSDARFPLVGTVLLGEQDGVVYVDDPRRPRCAYVEHAFGFAQILGEADAAFDASLERHLIVERSFAAPKIRLYTPRMPPFLDDPRHAGMRSLRQRFVMGAGTSEREAMMDGCVAAPVDAGSVAAADRAFGVVTRFWRSAADFVAKAHAILVTRGGEPASICYAAAVVDGEAEIDVATRPEHQRLGLGRIAAEAFVRHCRERGLQPLWDCFANNAGSMQLSRAAGFTPKGAPYPFFTINR